MATSLPSFDELRQLAEQRPEALEALRRELTNAVIDRAPPGRRQRLRGLQFQIETRCRLAPNPLAACVVVSGMMRDTFEDLRLALNYQLPRPRRRCPVVPLH